MFVVLRASAWLVVCRCVVYASIFVLCCIRTCVIEVLEYGNIFSETISTGWRSHNRRRGSNLGAFCCFNNTQQQQACLCSVG